jgi:hypothetical protein
MLGQFMLDNMRQLYPRGAANRGICVDPDGAMLGPECVLVRRTITGFRGIERDDASTLQKCVFGADREQDWLFRQCQRIADALGRGEIALAQIYGLHIPIGELDDRQLKQVARTYLAKTGFNPDEPRIPKGDPHGGEWTTGGDGSEASPATALSMTTPSDGPPTGDAVAGNGESASPDNPPIKWEMKPFSDTASGSASSIDPAAADRPGMYQFLPAGAGFAGDESRWLAGELAPTTLEALKALLARTSGGAIVFGILFIPSNRSPVVEGQIANSPDLSYRYDSDAGVLQLRQDIGSLGSAVLGEAHIGSDGLFRDAEGHVIGRYLSGSGAVIDTGALPGYRMLPGTNATPDAAARQLDRP